MLTRAVACAAAAAVVLSLAACSGGNADAEPDNRPAMPAAAGDLEGKQFADVVGELEEAGFANIETVALGNLITGWLHEEGEVDEIEVDGETEFEADQRFDPEVEIIVSYYSFPEDDDEVERGPSAEPSTAPAPSEAVLTPDNSPELAAILKAADTCSADVAAFATAHKGQTIAFDANIGAMVNHGSTSTRYDILILSGDLSVTGQPGPTFQFRDVNTTNDLHYTGSIPDSIGAGDNLRVTAEILEYEERSCLLLLEPIATQFR